MSVGVEHGGVDDLAVGRAVRAIRIRRGLRQEDVAAAAGLSRQQVSRLECGQLDELRLSAIRAIARTLEIRVTVTPSWRGGDLDRLVGAGHAAMHESVAALIRGWPGWVGVPEVTSSIFGERGSIDILAWHEVKGALLVIELKTEITDPAALVAQTDRYRRLAPQIAHDRGWKPQSVSVWVVVAGSTMNRARVGRHKTMLRNAFPLDGRSIDGWLAKPASSIGALSFVRNVPHAGTPRTEAPIKRVSAARRVRRADGNGRNGRGRGVASC